MNFSDALQALQQGKKIKSSCLNENFENAYLQIYNGYLCICREINQSIQIENSINKEHITYRRRFTPNLCKLLVEDWEIVDV